MRCPLIVEPLCCVASLLQTKNILIAVGGKPTRLPIPGAELCITSDEALELSDQPKKITVLGGGYIALEFSGIFQRFGSEVHTVFRQPLPLRGFDEEVRITLLCSMYLIIMHGNNHR